MDWEVAKAMTYGDAQKYIEEHTIERTGWQVVLEQVKEPAFWAELFRRIGLAAVLFFFLSLVLLKWVKVPNVT